MRPKAYLHPYFDVFNSRLQEFAALATRVTISGPTGISPPYVWRLHRNVQRLWSSRRSAGGLWAYRCSPSSKHCTLGSNKGEQSAEDGGLRNQLTEGLERLFNVSQPSLLSDTVILLRRRKNQVSYLLRIKIAKWTYLLPRSRSIYPQKRSVICGAGYLQVGWSKWCRKKNGVTIYSLWIGVCNSPSWLILKAFFNIFIENFVECSEGEESDLIGEN